MNIIYIFILFLSLSSNVFAIDDSTIVLDSGHDPIHKGAKSICGKYEYEYNDEIVNLISAHSKHKLYLTREPENWKKIFSNNNYSVEESLKSRVTILKKIRPKLFISIHHDSNSENFLVADPSACGWKGVRKLNSYFKKKFNIGTNIFIYKEKSERYFQSLMFANILGEKLKSSGRQFSNYHVKEFDDCKSCFPINLSLGIWHQNLFVLRENNYPSVLIEIGNILDEEDERQISSIQFKKKFAEILDDAITEYLHMYTLE
jgi:N-acetylmuramoyl-L-alanine amidase